MFRDSVKSTGYPLHSPVSPSLPLQYVTVCHHISTGLYLRNADTYRPNYIVHHCKWTQSSPETQCIKHTYRIQRNIFTRLKANDLSQDLRERKPVFFIKHLTIYSCKSELNMSICCPPKQVQYSLRDHIRSSEVSRSYTLWLQNSSDITELQVVFNCILRVNYNAKLS